MGAWIGQMLARESAEDAPQPLTWQHVLEHLLAFRRDVVRVRTNIDQLAKVAAAAGQDDRWIRRLAEVTDRILGRNAARNAVVGARSGLGEEDPEGIAHATADTFTALATITKGTNIHGRMIHTADTYDRAARAPTTPYPPSATPAPNSAASPGNSWRCAACVAPPNTTPPSS